MNLDLTEETSQIIGYIAACISSILLDTGRCKPIVLFTIVFTVCVFFRKAACHIRGQLRSKICYLATIKSDTHRYCTNLSSTAKLPMDDTAKGGLTQF